MAVTPACCAWRRPAAVAAVGSTVAVTTMEYEPGGIEDLSQALERLVPAEGDYAPKAGGWGRAEHAILGSSVGWRVRSLPPGSAILSGPLRVGASRRSKQRGL